MAAKAPKPAKILKASLPERMENIKIAAKKYKKILPT
jgi:hypothetical protein